MKAKHFDIIVFGENLAGLVAAALLAGRKYSVLLVRRVSGPGRENIVGAVQNRTRLIFPGIFELPVPAAVIRELSLGHKFRSIYKPADPLFQLVESGHRLTVRPDRLRLAMEFSREYGEDASPEAIGELMSALEEANAWMNKLLVPGLPFHPDGMKEKWNLSGRIKEFYAQPEGAPERLAHLDELWRKSRLGRWIRRVEGIVGDTGEGFDSLFARRRGFALFSEVMHQLAGEGVEEILVERVEKRGGKILEQTALQEAEFKRSGYLFHDASYTYGAESVVFSCDHFLAPQILPTPRMTKWRTEASEKLRPSHTWLRVSFSLARTVIPEGMEHGLFQTGPKGSPPLYYRRDPLIGEDVDAERLDVFRPIPVESYTAEGLGEIQQDVIRRAKELIPFLEDHLRKVYLEKPPSGSDRESLDALGGRRLVYRTHRTKDLFRGLPFQLPLKNAYLAGPEVLPELGMEGEFITGWAIARQIQQKKPRKDELK